MSVKRKKMTSREKDLKARMKKEMQEKGIIPPDKPKLNREKFVKEALEEWNCSEEDYFVLDMCLHEAIGFMTGKRDRNLRVSQEAVGVAKCLKLALRLLEFKNKLRAEGRKEYTLKEKFDFIEDILNA